MKKIRILALILALLMLPLSVLVGCKKPDDDNTDPSECRHKWTREEISKRGCDTPGVTQKTCARCGAVETETKAPYGHYMLEAVSNNDASCTEDGTKTSRCSRYDICGYSETVADEGSALGHTFPDDRYKPFVGEGGDKDEFVESAVCIKCEAFTDYRLLGLNIDFEGDKSHLSYTKLDEYFVDGAGSVETKTEGEGENANSYLSITRDNSVFAGNSAFGIVLTPRADMLKGTSLTASPYYVVEFDVRISKTKTKDLVLLSGTKKGVTENFIKYNSGDGTLVTAAGTAYSFKDSDYDRWVKISVVLNDGSKEYTVYVDGYQLTFDKDGEKATEIAYATVDGYYLGYDVENFKIGLTAEVGVASEFDIDNIQHYLGSQPKGYEGPADPEYFIYTTANGDKIVYKIADESCAHTWGDTTVVQHTCISTGYSIHTCSKCGGQEIFNISTGTLGTHNFEEITIIPATCTETAFRQEQCTECGLKNGAAVGSPLGHEIDEDAESTQVIEPTCTERGYTFGYCIRCNLGYKIKYTDPLGHEIDMTKPETYEVVEADCENGGYTVGQCKRCDVSDYVIDETEPLGHVIDPNAPDYVKVEVDCITDGYEQSTCGREGCEEEYRVDGGKAFGHSMISEIKEVLIDGSASAATKRVLVSKCSRCAEIASQQDLSTKVPNHTELIALVGKDNMLGDEDKAGILHFDGTSTPAGSVYGDDTADGDGLPGVLVARYSKYVIKDDFHNAGNRYMEWSYSPQTASATPHSHIDYQLGRTTMGRDVTFEISLRIPDGLTEVVPIYIQVTDNSKTGINANHTVNLINVSKTGLVTLASKHPIAQLKQSSWTRLSFVFHTTNATFDIYVDGVMTERNVMLELSKPNQAAFKVIDFFRINAYDNATVTRKIDIDEVYAYYSDVPAYVTDVKLAEKSGMSAFTEDMNTIKSGYNYPYVSTFEFCDAKVQRFTHLIAKKSTRLFVDSANGNALHYLKNSSVSTVPNSPGPSENNSFIDIYLAHTARSEVDGIVEVKHQYKTMVFETEITIKEGTGDFEIIRAIKDGASQNYTFLNYKGGNIVSGNDVIVENVELERKYTLAVVFRDDDFNYDIYVDGYLVRERVPYVDGYKTENISGRVFFRSFVSTGDMDILIHSVNIYGGKETPLLNLGRATYVKVDGNFVTNAVAFTEDYDYSVHYPSNKKANGDYVYTSSTSTLEIVSGLEKSENDLGLGLIKIDKDGEIGEEAENEPVWALKTGDWGANCTTSNGELQPLKFYPMNVPMNGDNYDLTGYESITFKYYVEKSAGYKFLITMNSSNAYFYYLAEIKAGTKGWQELTVNFNDFSKAGTIALNQITDIRFNFSGWADRGVGTPSENRPGKAGSGTTLYLAGINLTSQTLEETLGMYVKQSEKFCGDGNHTFGETVNVAPTVHMDGYSYKTCTSDGCGYVEIVEELDGTALGHVVSGEPTSVNATCTADGKVVYDVNCDVCGDIVVGGKTNKLPHNWVKSEQEGTYKDPTCTEDGYYTYTCSGGCNATATLVAPKLGHTKDEAVETTVVEADCENGGYKKDHCSVCDQDYIYDEVGALGHTRDASVISEGNCEDDRVIKYTCSRCDWEETEITVEAPGHSWSSWQTIDEPSCADGLKRRDCTVCDGYEERPIPAVNEHNLGTEQHVKQPSVESEGYTYTECSACGYHNIIDGTVVPAIFEGTQDLKFVITGDVAVIEKYTGTATNIVVPGTYAGKPVVITRNSFSGNTAIISITLGEGITEIDVSSFEGCTSLRTIVIPKSITAIDKFAFKDCDALTTVYYAGATKLVAGGSFEASGNGKFFDATWNCNYGA